jgi:hypothetical protein
MAVHERQQPPAGHGEVLCSPPFATWAETATRNHDATAAWPAPLRELREQARAEALNDAAEYSSALGISGAPSTSPLIAMTGHQPELYHPGVWVKDFLIQRFSEETGATGVDVVVDTDLAGAMDMRTPCLVPEVRVCRVRLAEGGPEAAFVQVAPPDAERRRHLRDQGLSSLRTLPAPALARHFTTFCDALDAAAEATSDLASCMTATRRAYEIPAAADYLELPVSVQVRSAAYRRFAAGLLLDAPRFRDAMNEALGAYRRRTGTRSQAQPFPDLGTLGDRVEAPFWLLSEGRRRPLSVDSAGRLYADGTHVADLGTDPDLAAERIGEQGLLIAPKALTLTLFERVFVADLFVHGTGGGRYDRVTDAVIREYYGIEPPAFAVASMTMLLPLGAHFPSDEEISGLEQRLHRFTHNPDQVLGEVEFDTNEECERAEELAREKRELVTAIGQPDADRKTLGQRIRVVNEDLAALLQPMVIELTETVDRLRSEREAADVLRDRTYPYCLWDPREVMDKVR